MTEQRNIEIKHFSPATMRKNEPIPFNHHPLFPKLLDIVSRKFHPHVILHTDFSSSLHSAFLEAFALSLTQETSPLRFRNADFFYFPKEFFLSKKNRGSLNDHLTITDHDLFIALSLPESIDDYFFDDFLEPFFLHPQCHLLLLTSQKENIKSLSEYHFNSVSIPEPTDTDLLLLLQQKRVALEHFHHVFISKEAESFAYSLVKRYVHPDHRFEKALQLLDSSAARVRQEYADSESKTHPALTQAIIATVLAEWLNLPETTVSLAPIDPQTFIHDMQEHVFHQDQAITLLAHELQRAPVQLQKNTGPFLNFLFVGPDHCGKKTTALALAQQLFKQINMVYTARLHTSASLTHLLFERYIDQKQLTLQQLITETPYAMMIIEAIEHASSHCFNELQTILSTGYWHDECGKRHDFRQATLILNTTCGNDRLTELANSFSANEEPYTLDLIQWMVHEPQQDSFHHALPYSPQDIADDLMAHLVKTLPKSLCQKVSIIPFFPLNKAAIEKLLRLELKILGEKLVTTDGIELTYAPEVIVYLMNHSAAEENTFLQRENMRKHLYASVEQALTHPIDHRYRAHQLFLQLNDTGQLLRCDWLAAPTLRHHAP